MNELTPEKLAELRRLLDAATPRTQLVYQVEDEVLIELDDDSNHWPGRYTAIARGFEQGDDYGLSDAMLVTAAVNALPALLDAVAERDALAAKVERVRALADLIDRHTEFESDPVDFRDASHGGSWDDVADRIRAMLDATPETGGES